MVAQINMLVSFMCCLALGLNVPSADLGNVCLQWIVRDTGTRGRPCGASSRASFLRTLASCACPKYD